MTTDHLDDPVAIAAERWPDRVVLETDAGVRFTASDLEVTVAERAGRLRDTGVEVGTRVAITTADRLEACLDILAVIRAGGVAAPFDPDRAVSPDRLTRAGIECAIDPSGRIDASIPDVDPAAVSSTVDPLDPTPIPADRPISLVFTSGTTGRPRPIVHTAANHDAAGEATIDHLGLDTTDRWFVPLGLHHMGGFAPLTRCLPNGIVVTVSETLAPADLAERIDRCESTVASVVPTMLYRLVEANAAVPPSLRCLLVGGAPLREPLFQRARDDNWPVWASYGLTETIGQVTTATPAERDTHPGTVGTPLPGVAIRILDDDGASRPAGGSGRIEIRSPTVSPSVGEAEGDGMVYETADIGHIDADGRLWVHGRVDDAIHSGGEVIFPQRIEGVIAAHPAVEDAAVVGLADLEWGERAVAAIVTDGVDHAVITEWCRERLAPFEVPKAVVTVDSIPRTVSATVDRRALKTRLVDG